MIGGSEVEILVRGGIQQLRLDVGRIAGEHLAGDLHRVGVLLDGAGELIDRIDRVLLRAGAVGPETGEATTGHVLSECLALGFCFCDERGVDRHVSAENVTCGRQRPGV